jgi:SulP family sulfate permease
LTGLTFFLLGFFRLGSLLGFFPRHILVGCIGGVGVFLIITGLNVSTRRQDDDFPLSLDTLLFFVRGHNLTLWVPAFALAALLRIITSRWHHQLILPTCTYPSFILVEDSPVFRFF